MRSFLHLASTLRLMRRKTPRKAQERGKSAVQINRQTDTVRVRRQDDLLDQGSNGIARFVCSFRLGRLCIMARELPGARSNAMHLRELNGHPSMPAPHCCKVSVLNLQECRTGTDRCVRSRAQVTVFNRPMVAR